MNDHLKIPPHSEEAEQAVIGGLMLDNCALDAVMGVVKPEDFYRYDHRLIFDALLALDDASKPLDFVTVAEWLDEHGQLEDAGGLAYVAGVAKDVPSAANVKHYAEIVRGYALKRRMIQAGNQLSTLGYEHGDAKDALDEAQRLVLALDADQLEGGPRLLKDTLREWVDDLDRLAENDTGMTGVSTGFADLDKLTGGMEAGDLWVIAARPSIGKTATALDIAEYLALREKLPVLMFSLEMPAKQLTTRAVAKLGKLDISKLRHAKLEENDWPRVTAATRLIQDARLFVDDTPGLTVRDMRSRARRVKNRHGLGLVVVDHMQLVYEKAENRTQEITRISGGLKALAKTLDCPVLALSQLNRGVEQRADKRPHMADLREGGSIEQDADVIAFLYREQYYDKHFPLAVAELNIEKQRNGPLGQVLLAHRAEQITFADLDHHGIREYHDELRASATPAKVARFSGGFKSGRDRAAGDS